MDINILFTQLFEESGNFIIMFFVAGIALDCFFEVIKKQIYPKATEEEKQEGKESKKCPAWVGMLFGLANTAIFSLFSIIAHLNNTPHCIVIGGLTWFFVWAVAFYLYQMGASILVKLIMRRLFPKMMTGKPRKSKDDRPIYQVPKGAKIEYVDKEDISE